MKGYVLSVTLCALCCSISASAAGRGKALRLVWGVMLALVLLQPLGKLRGIRLPAELVSSGQQYLQEGASLAREHQFLHIQGACEAYVLEKAQSLGAQIQVQILLDEELLPAEAVLRGDVSREGRALLEQLLVSDLGITKENLRWIGIQE